MEELRSPGSDKVDAGTGKSYNHDRADAQEDDRISSTHEVSVVTA